MISDTHTTTYLREGEVVLADAIPPDHLAGVHDCYEQTLETALRLGMVQRDEDTGWSRRVRHEPPIRLQGTVAPGLLLPVGQGLFHGEASDPYVWLNSPNNNTGRIEECVTEMNRNATGIYSAKKTVVVLWWWNPNASNPVTDANTAAIYKTSFEDVKADVDGLAGFNFSGTAGQLNTYNNALIEALWDEVVDQNDNV